MSAAQYIYIALIAMNVTFTLYMHFAIEGVTKRQVAVNVVTNTAAAMLVMVMPTWLTIILNVLMVASLTYAAYLLLDHYELLRKSNVIEEEFHVSDLDPEDPLSASIIAAWERAQRD